MSRRGLLLLCTIAFAVTLAWTSSANQTQTTEKTQSSDMRELEKQARRLDDQAAKEPNDKVFSLLSKQLDVPVATLQSEKQSTKFGFGELFIANALAKSSGKTFDQIAQEFRQGRGWGEIAKQNGVKLGRVVSQIKSANKSVGSAMNHASKSSQGSPAKGKSAPPPATGRGSGRGRG